MLRILILSLSILFSICSHASETVMEIVQLNYRPAEEIQPLISPFLEESEQLIANSSNLIIKATPTRLKELKNLINKLDTALSNLTITVIQSKSKTAEQLNASANIKLSSSNHPRSHPSMSVYGRFGKTNNLSNTDSTQVVRTLEGKSAYIKTGTTHPVQNITVYDSGSEYSGFSSNTQLIETSSGFLVTPRLTGQQVTVEITPWSDKMNHRGNIETQSANSTIRVNLGEWVEIGGIREQSQISGSRILAHTYSTTDNDFHILIKIEKTDY